MPASSPQHNFESDVRGQRWSAAGEAPLVLEVLFHVFFYRRQQVHQPGMQIVWLQPAASCLSDRVAALRCRP